MKKILILLLMLPLMASAQIKLYPKFAASYGDDKLQILHIMSNQEHTYFYANYMFRTGLDATYKKLTIYYDTKIWCSIDKIKFDPQQASFEIGITYNITDKIKINAHHICRHPIIANNGKYHDGLYGGGNAITISYGY